MKIIEAISQIDSLMHNTYTQSDKVTWLSRLDAMVKRTVIDTHESGNVEFSGYDDSTDPNTQLLIPEPFDEAYLRWLEAQIHYHNGEYDKYNNAVEAFHGCYQDYKIDYNRTHMPKGMKLKYF